MNLKTSSQKSKREKELNTTKRKEYIKTENRFTFYSRILQSLKMGSLSVFLLSLVIGVASHFLMTVLMARWAFREAANSTSEEDDINGQVAIVTKEISPENAGEISWEAWGKTHVLTATALSGTSIPRGTEVVIDVVEDGIARVELWSVVESRL